MRILVSDDKLQLVLNALLSLLSAQPTAHIVVLPVEMSLPKQDDEERKQASKQEHAATEAREALYEGVEKGG
jgi:hypothetical protein